MEQQHWPFLYVLYVLYVRRNIPISQEVTLFLFAPVSKSKTGISEVGGDTHIPQERQSEGNPSWNSIPVQQNTLQNLLPRRQRYHQDVGT